VLLSSGGLILTNNHVAAPAAGGAGQITVLFQDGRSTHATIVGRDPSSDIAVVQADNVSGLTPITLGDSTTARVGERVVAVGSPLGLGGTVTTGIISALHRAVIPDSDGPPNDPTTQEVLDAIQTDATINPGNSGGPLVDLTGRLIGINTAIASLGGAPDEQTGSVRIGFAVPINEVTRIASDLQHTGHATKALLGATLEIRSPLATPPDPPGARIVGVTPPTGPAGAAGLKAGDIVIQLDDRAITTGAELIAAIRSHAPGDTVTVRLSDGRAVAVVLGSQPVPATK
jgi:putative serine protease PepD